MTAETAAFAVPRAAPRRMSLGWLWPTALLVLLTFLVIYPVAMLLLGALTNTNPVVDGFGVFDLSLTNFITVLGNPNVHLALANSLIACGGGTALAVIIGLTFSWVVVRTDTPCKRFIAAVSMIPLFVPPLVAAVAWSILASPKTGLLNTIMKWVGIDWRFDVYTMGGLIVIFGIYYAPYVYMFTASALRNMDPALEEAAEVSGASAVRILFTVTFPLIAPAIISGMLLSFIVMLGIYGIPAVLGAPGDIPVLTTYIFKLTNWSPPLYSTAASVAIILMIVTGFLVYLQQRVVSGRSYITVAGKAFRPGVMRLGRLALFHARPRDHLPRGRGRAADARADRGGIPQVPVHPQRREPVRHAAVFAHPLRAAVRQSAGAPLDLEHHGGRARHSRCSAASWRLPSATRSIARRPPAARASTSSRPCRSRSPAS